MNPQAEGLRAAVYVRVSSAAKLGRQSQRPQWAALRDLCRLRGWRIVGVYRDRASGVKARPGLARALHDAQMRRYDVLVAWSLDRIGRSLIEVVSRIEALDKRGIRVAFARDGGCDTTTASGRLITSVLAAAAQFERERMIERTKEAAAAAKGKGKRWGRPRLPYDVAAAAARVAAGEPIARVAASITIERRKAGQSRGEVRPLSARTLARHLRAHGVATPNPTPAATGGSEAA